MSKLTSIKHGKENKPPRVIIYGQEGIGKSTFASNAPSPIFIQTEDGLGEIDCAKFPISTTYSDVVENISTLGTEEHEFKTVVIDSADWLEPLILTSVCEEYGVDGIHKAAGGFNRGYEKAVDKWSNICQALNWLRDTKGMGVIIIAHSKIKTFNDPENPAYDKYMMRLNDKACDYLTEWADAVLFATRKMVVSKNSDGKNKAIAIGAAGGERVLRCIAGPACSAKNRYNLPEEMPLDWASFEKAINANKENYHG